MTKDTAKARILKILNKPGWGASEIETILEALRTRQRYNPPTITSVLDCAAIAVDLFPEDLTSRTRMRKAVIGRSLVYKELRAQGMTYQAIGNMFNKDHATVLHNLNRFNDDLSINWKPAVEAYNKFTGLCENLLEIKEETTL